MQAREYFPLGKAYGEAFCNRESETEQLVGNIMVGKHTFLIAPRRYGKSSLAEKAIRQSKLPWSKVDFHLAVREKDAERLILLGVIDLIGKSISRIDKMAAQIKQFAKSLKPKFDLETTHLKLELEVASNSLPTENIAEAILLLEGLLREKNTRAVLLLDEFQEVGGMSEGYGIEGAIRSVAQETRFLSIIFSGSNPHLLRNMFENNRRPLYNLCKRIVIPRISKAHYHEHLNTLAKMSWNKKLDDTVFNEIMALTERHPYYVNLLCDYLWTHKTPPNSVDAVKKSWAIVVDGERSDLIKDFLSLSDNQRIVLKHIATMGGKHLMGANSLEKSGLPISSMTTAIAALEAKDLIEKRDGSYRLIIPAFQEILREGQ